CFPLGPSPLEIVRQILSANFSALGVPTIEDLRNSAAVMDAEAANNSSDQSFKKYHCDLFGTCYKGPQINRQDPAKAIKWYLCGHGSFDNIKNYTLEGLGKGA